MYVTLFLRKNNQRSDEKCEKKYQTFNIISIACYVLLVIYAFITWRTLPVAYFEGPALSVIITVLLYLALPIASFVVAGIIFGKFKNKQYVEYDYMFITGTIKVARVIRNNKRKFLFKFDVKNIINIGKYNSETYKNITKSKLVTPEFLTTNSKPAEEKAFYYMYVNCYGVRRLFIFECTKTFIINTIRFCNKTAVEKGVL